MRRTLLAGGILAVLVFLLVDHGAHLGPSFAGVALAGVCFGAGLGLVPGLAPSSAPGSRASGGSAGWRAGGFLVGYLLAFLAFAFRAALLPDIPLGAALAALFAVALTAGGCAVTRGRMPLWAGLLGVGSLSAAYETAFEANPTTFLSVAPAMASALLLAVSLGYLVAVLLVELAPQPSRASQTAPAHTETSVQEIVPPPVGVAGAGDGVSPMRTPAGGTQAAGTPAEAAGPPAGESEAGLDILPGARPAGEGRTG